MGSACALEARRVEFPVVVGTLFPPALFQALSLRGLLEAYMLLLARRALKTWAKAGTLSPSQTQKRDWKRTLRGVSKLSRESEQEV